MRGMDRPDTSVRLLAFAAILATLLVAEWRRPLVDPPPRRGVVRLHNLALGTIGALAVRLLLPWIAIDAAMWAQNRGVGLAPLLQLPTALAGVAGFLALDLAVYLQHRAFHRLRWLWRLHAVHHSEAHLDATTGLRFHPAELLISMLWKTAVVVALGVPAVAVLSFEVALNAMALVTHANLGLSTGVDRIARRLLVTPLMHRRHHSTALSESLHNFGFNLTLWDRAFGTYDPRWTSPGQPPIGLPGVAVTVEPGLWSMLSLTFRY